MGYYEGDILDEELIGTHSNWDNENAIIGDNIFILTQDTDVVKKGNSVNTFIDLESIVDINDLNDIIDNYSNYIDTELSNDSFNKIAFLNTSLKIDRTDVLESDLDLNIINGQFVELSSVVIPLISGPLRKRYGTSFSLKANSFSSYRDKGGYIETYEWILPNNTSMAGEEITINIDDDPNLVGTTLLYSCQATDIFGNKSKISYFTVTIANYDFPVVFPEWEFIETNPSIIDLLWSNDTHVENNSYDLTISAIDPQGQDLTYQVECNDENTVIVQDESDETLFHITYPEFSINTLIDFIVTVTNEDLYFDIAHSIKIVSNIEIEPVINNLVWNSDIHIDNNSYELIINASDENNQNLTYEVTCDDINVNITQDSIDETLFHITYPGYSVDTVVTYTITVTNEDLLVDTKINSKIVYTIIDNLIWSNNNHQENGTYDLTIDATDPQGQNLTYEVECDDPNVDIIQDGIDDNIFHITYPEYTEDTTVTYTIKAINEDLMIDIETDTKIVANVPAGGERGVFSSGGGSIIVDYVTISTPGNATDFGYLTHVTNEVGGTSNGTNDRGVFAGELFGGDHRTIEYITISTPGNGTDFGNLINVKIKAVATSNGTNERGIFTDGWNENAIEYITISTPGDATDFGDLSVFRYDIAACSNATNDRGIFAGGHNSNGNVDVIDYITISTPGNTTDFGDLTLNRHSLTATSNGINERGVFAGGTDGISLYSDLIEYITISTLGNAYYFGDLTNAKYNLAATSNGINNRGLFGGGLDINQIILDIIEYITISSIGNAIDFGDLTIYRHGLAACSDA